MKTIGKGQLDRRITIQRSTSTANALNEPVLTWSDYLCREPAMRRDVSDGEKMAAGQIGSFLRSRFTIRASQKSRAITPKDRMIHDCATWSIHGIKEAADQRGRFLEITAVKDADL